MAPGTLTPPFCASPHTAPCLTGGQEVGGGQLNKPGTVKGVHVYAYRVAVVKLRELRASIIVCT